MAGSNLLMLVNPLRKVNLAYFDEQLVAIGKSAAPAQGALNTRISQFYPTRVDTVTHSIDDFIELYRHPPGKLLHLLHS